MKNLLCFNSFYFICAVLLFITEVLIGLYVNDKIIRPYGGDFLVVILLYCLLRSFFNIPTLLTAIGVLLVSFLIEFLQYLNIVDILGLSGNKLARIVIGTSFSWDDIIAYTLGVLTIIALEYLFESRNQKTVKTA